MVKKLNLKENKTVEYELQYKKVKNINLRIKPDGKICVSADRSVSQKYIEEFLLSKADFIIGALERFKNEQYTESEPIYTEQELVLLINEICNKVYPYYSDRGISFPQIKYKKMVSRWGSCHPVKGILTFNLNLIYAPLECIEYVVLHEFTHFLQPNHSDKFYYELEKTCPNWREYRKKLKEIHIR